MRINSNQQNFQGALNNKYLLKGLEKISEHSATFGAGVSFVSAIALRPIAINLTPNVKKENKDYLSASSISSGLIKLAIVEAIVFPIEKAIKKIDKNPEKYLKKETINNLAQDSQLANSKNYKFITQLIKSGSNLISAIPKSMLTVALIPIILDKFFPKKEQKKKNEEKIPFKGKLNDTLAKNIGKIIDNKNIQDFAQKNNKHNSNISRNISVMTDLLLAGTYIFRTKKSKKIEEKKKNVLIANEAITTGICLSAGVGIDKLVKYKSQNILEQFKTINKNDPKLIKYIEGINIARPTLIFALIYYGILPIISTHLADKTTDK